MFPNCVQAFTKCLPNSRASPGLNRISRLLEFGNRMTDLADQLADLRPKDELVQGYERKSGIIPRELDAGAGSDLTDESFQLLICGIVGATHIPQQIGSASNCS